MCRATLDDYSQDKGLAFHRDVYEIMRRLQHISSALRVLRRVGLDIRAAQTRPAVVFDEDGVLLAPVVHVCAHTRMRTV